MPTPHLICSRRLLPALAVVISLAGCDATNDYYRAQRIEAETGSTVASAQLASTQALSATLSTVTSQNAALVNTVTAQATAWQIVAVILATGLAVSIPLAVLLASRKRPQAAPTVVYMLPNSPTHDAALLLDDPQEWPEVKARRRAARLAAPQDRYRLTAGR